MRHLLFSLAILASCTKAGGAQESPPTKEPGLAPITPLPQPPAKAATVELTSVTLADDCGGAPPWQAPAIATPPALKAAAKADPTRREQQDRNEWAAGVSGSAMSRAKRRCEQTSMQLAIVTTSATSIRVKSVELFDASGKSLGTLAPSKPTRWDDATSVYATWDEKLAAGTTSHVSYVLAQPDWESIGDRWNKTFTLKAVVSVGGIDAAAQKDVTLSAPTSLPPNVRT